MAWNGYLISFFFSFSTIKLSLIFFRSLFSGDTCCFSFSLGSFRDFLIDILGPNTYVKSIRIGNNVVEDYESGYFVHPDKQVEEACRQISSDPMLQNGYNAVGFSQGSQFL